MAEAKTSSEKKGRQSNVAVPNFHRQTMAQLTTSYSETEKCVDMSYVHDCYFSVHSGTAHRALESVFPLRQEWGEGLGEGSSLWSED